jgi:hypothetical protein
VLSESGDLEFSGGCVCKHPPHSATHPGSSSTLTSAAGSDTGLSATFGPDFKILASLEVQSGEVQVDWRRDVHLECLSRVMNPSSRESQVSSSHQGGRLDVLRFAFRVVGGVVRTEAKRLRRRDHASARVLRRLPLLLRAFDTVPTLTEAARVTSRIVGRSSRSVSVRSLRRGRRCRRWWVVQTCVALISPHRSGSRRRSISGGARRRGCKGSPRW